MHSKKFPIKIKVEKTKEQVQEKLDERKLGVFIKQLKGAIETSFIVCRNTFVTLPQENKIIIHL